MLLAEQIAKKTDAARKESSVDRRFRDIMKSIDERAALMQDEYVIKKLTKYGVAHPAEVQWAVQYGSVIPEDVKARIGAQELEPGLVESLYKDQQEINDRLAAEGFNLTERALDLPSVLDPELTKEARETIEAYHKLIECEVVISWKHLTTVPA